MSYVGFSESYNISSTAEDIFIDYSIKNKTDNCITAKKATKYEDHKLGIDAWTYHITEKGLTKRSHQIKHNMYESNYYEPSITIEIINQIFLKTYKNEEYDEEYAKMYDSLPWNIRKNTKRENKYYKTLPCKDKNDKYIIDKEKDGTEGDWYTTQAEYIDFFLRDNKDNKKDKSKYITIKKSKELLDIIEEYIENNPEKTSLNKYPTYGTYGDWWIGKIARIPLSAIKGHYTITNIGE